MLITKEREREREREEEEEEKRINPYLDTKWVCLGTGWLLESITDKSLT